LAMAAFEQVLENFIQMCTIDCTLVVFLFIPVA